MGSLKKRSNVFAEYTFKYLFPNDDCKKLVIGECSIVNFIMYSIAKKYNTRMYKLFNYDEILCNQFPTINIKPVSNYKQLSADAEKIVEQIYLQLKNYIFNYINDHEIDIIKSVNVTKVNNEIVSMQESKFKDELENRYIKLLKEDKHLNGFGANISDLLYFINIATNIKYSNKTKEFIYNTEEYALKLIAAISEKLYYFILGEVKRIVEKGTIDSVVQPLESLDVTPQQPVLPQQLVDYDEAYVQQMLWNNMMQPQPPFVQSNIYTTQPNPVNIQPDVQPEFVNMDAMGFGFNPQEQTNFIEEMSGRKALTVDELQKKYDEIAAAREQQANSLKIDPALMESYNALDTCDKAIVGLFIQIILRNRNRASLII